MQISQSSGIAWEKSLAVKAALQPRVLSRHFTWDKLRGLSGLRQCSRLGLIDAGDAYRVSALDATYAVVLALMLGANYAGILSPALLFPFGSATAALGAIHRGAIGYGAVKVVAEHLNLTKLVAKFNAAIYTTNLVGSLISGLLFRYLGLNGCLLVAIATFLPMPIIYLRLFQKEEKSTYQHGTKAQVRLRYQSGTGVYRSRSKALGELAGRRDLECRFQYFSRHCRDLVSKGIPRPYRLRFNCSRRRHSRRDLFFRSDGEGCKVSVSQSDHALCAFARDPGVSSLRSVGFSVRHGLGVSSSLLGRCPREYR